MKKLLLLLPLLGLALTGCTTTKGSVNTSSDIDTKNAGTKSEETINPEKEWVSLNYEQYLIVTYGQLKKEFYGYDYSKLEYCAYSNGYIATIDVRYILEHKDTMNMETFWGNDIAYTVINYNIG